MGTIAIKPEDAAKLGIRPKKQKDEIKLEFMGRRGEIIIASFNEVILEIPPEMEVTHER